MAVPGPPVHLTDAAAAIGVGSTWGVGDAAGVGLGIALGSDCGLAVGVEFMTGEVWARGAAVGPQAIKASAANRSAVRRVLAICLRA